VKTETKSGLDKKALKNCLKAYTADLLEQLGELLKLAGQQIGNVQDRSHYRKLEAITASPKVRTENLRGDPLLTFVTMSIREKNRFFESNIWWRGGK